MGCRLGFLGNTRLPLGLSGRPSLSAQCRCLRTPIAYAARGRLAPGGFAPPDPLCMGGCTPPNPHLRSPLRSKSWGGRKAHPAPLFRVLRTPLARGGPPRWGPTTPALSLPGASPPDPHPSGATGRFSPIPHSFARLRRAHFVRRENRPFSVNFTRVSKQGSKNKHLHNVKSGYKRSI